MNENDNNSSDIPESLYSFEKKDLFTHCLCCEKYLLDGEDYMIEKSVRQYPGYKASDVIFDCAICMSCAASFQKEISDESKSVIESFFAPHFQSKERLSQIERAKGVDDILSKCLVSGKQSTDCEEFQLFALCKGKRINQVVPPYMISGSIIDQLQEQLSQSTKDSLGGFYEKYFSPDPSLVGNDPRLVLF